MSHHRCLILAAGLALLTGCVTTPPAPPRTVTSDDGLSEITASSHWQTRPNIGRSAAIRLVDATRDGYLLVTTYLPSELKPMSLEAFSDLVSNALAKNLANGKVSAPRLYQVNGRAAIEREISGTIDDTRLVYLSTVIDGERARYHLTAWALADRYPALREELRHLAGAFRESAQRRPERPRIDLHFQWPAPAGSRVTFETRSSRRGNTMTIRGEVLMTVKAAGADELVVKSRVTNQKTAFSNARGDANPGKEAYLQQVLKAALTDIPDYVVNRDGEFVRVDNLAAYHERVQAALVKGLPANQPEVLTKARQAVQSMMNEEALSLLMQDEWNNTVGHWAGGSYVVGESYPFRLPYHAPALGNQTFDMVMTQQLVGRVPCHAGAPASPCVRLLLHARVAGDDYTAAINRLVRRTLGHDITVTDTAIDTHVEIIADPKSLLPHRTHKKQVKRVTVKVAGQTQTTEDIEETTASYRY